jgi:phenylalanine-4-hydroxylase
MFRNLTGLKLAQIR